MKVKAFAPGNISCIFSIVINKDPSKSGSRGVGFTVNEGVLVTINKINIKKNIIKFNNKNLKFPTIEYLIKKLTKNKVEVEISSKLPLGCGFGLSGASALATAYTLNKLFNLKKSKKELARLAHISEVENGTGLGDVTNQYFGGFIIKNKLSFEFKVKKLSIKNKFVYYKIIGKINTNKVISNQKIKIQINKSCIDSLKNINKLINNKKNYKKNLLNKIIKKSNDFSKKSGLLKNKKLINLIESIEKKNGNASMIMLGNSVFSDKYFKGSKKLKISNKGACLI